jgi:tRNA pseudouridine55 synthase
MHKPVGSTSFSMVQACIDSARKHHPHKRPRICHGGTLDPFASGLLLMLHGPGARLFDFLHAIPKVYEGTVKWGEETDNGDPLGNVTFRGDTSGLTQTRLDEILSSFIGWQDQIPPATSAKRIGGERAYLKAHRGETVTMPASRVYLHEASWLDHDLPRESRIRIVVRGGYYVRAFVRDIGRLSGSGAHLSQLHRTSIGPWTDPGSGQIVELCGRDLLTWLPAREMSDQEVGGLRQGRPIPRGMVQPPDFALPEGFPGPEDVYRAFHLGRLTHLLVSQEGVFHEAVSLGRGL